MWLILQNQQPRFDDLGLSGNCQRSSTFDTETRALAVVMIGLLWGIQDVATHQSMCRSAVPRVIPFWEKSDKLLRDGSLEYGGRCDWSAYPESFSDPPQKAGRLLGLAGIAAPRGLWYGVIYSGVRQRLSRKSMFG